MVIRDNFSGFNRERNGLKATARFVSSIRDKSVREWIVEQWILICT